MVDGLGLLPRSGWPEVGDGAPHHLQQRPGPLQGCRLTAHQHREGAGSGTFCAAGDGRIQPGDPQLRKSLRQLPAAGWLDGGDVDHQRRGHQRRGHLAIGAPGPLGQGLGGSPRPEKHLLHCWAIAQAQHQHLGTGGGFRWAGGHLGPRCLEGPLPLPGAVVHRQGDACRLEIGRHGGAEGAEADKGRRGIGHQAPLRVQICR